MFKSATILGYERAKDSRDTNRVNFIIFSIYSKINIYFVGTTREETTTHSLSLYFSLLISLIFEMTKRNNVTTKIHKIYFNPNRRYTTSYKTGKHHKYIEHGKNAEQKHRQTSTTLENRNENDDNDYNDEDSVMYNGKVLKFLLV